ncbi:dUTP diphosphatase [Pseudorhodoplanes sp.]|uniref:dUTP diphosphatase n=1 Tax=Pseudorhodoplanes sp. TaxID=1934341 RepID=UPI003919AB80
MTDIEIEVVQLPHGAGLPLPSYQTAGAAGLDLLAAIPDNQPLHLAPGAYAMVPTGIALALPTGTEGQVRPRSGLAAKFGVTVLNAPGTIDSDYRGEVNVVLINHGKQLFSIDRGMRIAQLVIAPVATIGLRIVQHLDETARGAGGFGSTGAKSVNSASKG